MAKRKKVTKAEKRRRKQQRGIQEAQRLSNADEDEHDIEQLIDDFADRLTCSSCTAEDLAGICDIRAEDLEADERLAMAGLEMWGGRPGPPGELGAAIADFVAEGRRHLAAVEALRERFDKMAGDELFHTHIESAEAAAGSHPSSTLLPDSLR